MRIILIQWVLLHLLLFSLLILCSHVLVRNFKSTCNQLNTLFIHHLLNKISITINRHHFPFVCAHLSVSIKICANNYILKNERFLFAIWRLRRNTQQISVLIKKKRTHFFRLNLSTLNEKMCAAFKYSIRIYYKLIEIVLEGILVLMLARARFTFGHIAQTWIYFRQLCNSSNSFQTTYTHQWTWPICFILVFFTAVFLIWMKITFESIRWR